MKENYLNKDKEINCFIFTENNFLNSNFNSCSKLIIVFNKPIDNFCKEDFLLKLSLHKTKQNFLNVAKSK